MIYFVLLILFFILHLILLQLSSLIIFLQPLLIQLFFHFKGILSDIEDHQIICMIITAIVSSVPHSSSFGIPQPLSFVLSYSHLFLPHIQFSLSISISTKPKTCNKIIKNEHWRKLYT